MSQEIEKEAGMEEEKTTEEVKTGKTAGTMNILDLPPEIQHRILASLPNKTLSQSVRPVCRAWDKAALSIISNVYLRFSRRFNAANLDNLYPEEATEADNEVIANTYGIFLRLEKTLRHYFGPLMESGLPCLIPGQILDDTIRAFNWLFKPDKDSFANIEDFAYDYLVEHAPRITKAWDKGHFQCYFTRLMSLPLEAPMGRWGPRLPPSRARCFPYYNTPVEIARLRHEAHRYRRRAEEAEALLRTIAQKTEKDEEWKPLLTQHQEALHLSRAQEAVEEPARLCDENQKALAQLEEEMGDERERFGNLFYQGVYKDQGVYDRPSEERAKMEHDKAILRMEVERFKTLAHQAERTPSHIQAEKKCDTLRDLVAEAERLHPLLRSQADKERSLGYNEAEQAEESLRLNLCREYVAELEEEEADLHTQIQHAETERDRLRALIAEAKHDPALDPPLLLQSENWLAYLRTQVEKKNTTAERVRAGFARPLRLRYQANLEWRLHQTRAEKMEEERERLRALLARQPEHEEALLGGEQGQGRLQDGGQDEALLHPHLLPLSIHSKDPIPH